ncbi:hypothetical protein L228DRAFT_42891 [Xylona heveae TC161]|uniref:Uncharacterized protein n=1 Tax=Xylona heveae (strain CBS 132557 / TC161) TaxID=1328760 RepID=A0A164ZR29_XYLHT|nr:hypothetical protein L228DRAFT_42891 [Xylona heveae TC161]KZF19401.1 hypothetical protein L228DRAFT_42891 [Xylona heveae TC161]
MDEKQEIFFPCEGLRMWGIYSGYGGFDRGRNGLYFFCFILFYVFFFFFLSMFVFVLQCQLFSRK